MNSAIGLTGQLAVQEAIDEQLYIVSARVDLGWVAGDGIGTISGFLKLGNSQAVSGAAGLAFSALLDSGCASLFDLPAGATPGSLLNDLTVTYRPEGDPTTYATTTVTSTREIILDFNTGPGSAYLQGGASEAANTIIHELLHVAVDLYGAGAVSPQWNNNDTAPPNATPAQQAAADAAQNSEEQLIISNCRVGGP